MNIAEFSIKKSVIIWLMVIVFTLGGQYAYHNLGRYEDPEFTIKDAMVITPYPGATPKEVEEEVTDELETAIQQLPQLKRVTSISREGISEITVTIKDKYDKHSLPQVWDELRRKVRDIQAKLPPGAGPSMVNDDFGDVYGMLFAITGEGFNYRELKDNADVIKRELLLVPGVAKVQITGQRQEAIFVDISRTRMSQLGIPMESIYRTLRSQNMVTSAGSVRVGDEYVRISPTGAFDSINEIGNLLLKSGRSGRLIHLGSIAKVSRGFEEVPKNLVYYNGKAALLLGISIVSGGNVVKIGEAVNERLKALGSIVPVGIKIHVVYNQPDVVKESVRGFVVSLAEALAIVVVILLFAMGLQSGLIIAAILLLTVFGTLLIMYMFEITLQRISLGALIIALGMLVDNAIVVTEGIWVKLQQGIEKVKASSQVVNQILWPLFGSTVVGILAFAPIGLSQDKTGEYTASLFYVIFISLMLSWLLAVTVAPLFSYLFLNVKGGKQEGDFYGGSFYSAYKKLLAFCLNNRKLTMSVMVALLAASVYGFSYVKQSFFPDSTTAMFYIDFWHTQGKDIRATRNEMLDIEKYIKKVKGVTDVTAVVGKGAQRFMLVYEPEKANTSYGQFIVSVKDYREIPVLSEKIKQSIVAHYPDAEPKIKRVQLGTGGGAKIEARFSGPDANVLRRLSNQARDIMEKTPGAIDVRDDWRARVKVIEPVYSQRQARLTGVTRLALTDALETAFSGKQVGLYREGDELIPIISRPPDNERLDIANIDDLQIWSPLLRRTVPIEQVVSKFKTVWEDARIYRRNRKMTITASCEPESGPASIVLNRIKSKIEAIPLPAGYEFEWGGEYEDSNDAQTALAKQLPLGFLSMFVIVVVLFNAVRQPLIIWLTVPLSFIGVTIGLLMTGTEFGFMALLGFLSLSGMLIKNAIVLVDQIDLEVSEGKKLFDAIIDSSLARMRPVVLAAVTTVLGMIPLLFDAFFVSMAVVIMFGLSFATLLTLIVVPVLYMSFFSRSHAVS